MLADFVNGLMLCANIAVASPILFGAAHLAGSISLFG